MKKDEENFINFFIQKQKKKNLHLLKINIPILKESIEFIIGKRTARTTPISISIATNNIFIFSLFFININNNFINDYSTFISS